MMSQSHERLRAELAEEFGLQPASVEPEAVERLRAQIAVDEQWLVIVQKVSLTPGQLYRRYSHLRQRGRNAPTGRP